MSYLLPSTCSSERPLLPWSELSAEELALCCLAGSFCVGSRSSAALNTSLQHRNSLEQRPALPGGMRLAPRMHPF